LDLKAPFSGGPGGAAHGSEGLTPSELASEVPSPSAGERFMRVVVLPTSMLREPGCGIYYEIVHSVGRGTGSRQGIVRIARADWQGLDLRPVVGFLGSGRACHGEKRFHGTPWDILAALDASTIAYVQAYSCSSVEYGVAMFLTIISVGCRSQAFRWGCNCITHAPFSVHSQLRRRGSLVSRFCWSLECVPGSPCMGG
jgi:hypothetical protein